MLEAVKLSTAPTVPNKAVEIIHPTKSSSRRLQLQSFTKRLSELASDIVTGAGRVRRVYLAFVHWI